MRMLQMVLPHHFSPSNYFLPTHDISIFRKTVLLELILSRYAPVHILLVLVHVLHLCYSCDVSDFSKYDDFLQKGSLTGPLIPLIQWYFYIHSINPITEPEPASYNLEQLDLWLTLRGSFWQQSFQLSLSPHFPTSMDPLPSHLCLFILDYLC